MSQYETAKSVDVVITFGVVYHWRLSQFAPNFIHLYRLFPSLVENVQITSLLKPEVN